MKIKQFYVRRTSLSGEPGPKELLEIQMLDTEGRAISTVTIPVSIRNVRIGDYEIPINVIRAAAETEFASGRYVNYEGALITPF